MARFAGRTHVFQEDLLLPPGTTLGELRERFGIHSEDTGYIFLNAVLCDVPGLDVSADLKLNDRDHIGIFSRVHMWPYQYRDGIRMTEALKEALKERGAMHHTYKDED